MIPAAFSYTVLNRDEGGRDVPAEVRFRTLKVPAGGTAPMATFAVVRNEMYFLPHFLQHYRGLGVREFWFLDDSSTDGTREHLLAQPDCGVLESNRRFGDTIGQMRFGEAVKTLVPRAMFQGRWLLTVDADEFLLLPRAHPTVDALVKALGHAGLKVARAVMTDFFPATLRSLQSTSPAADPFAICPFFDAWTTIDWPTGQPQPGTMSMLDGVRPRMLVELLERRRERPAFLRDYRFAAMNKLPLVLWQADTEMYTAHHGNLAPSDAIQLAIAHFKFYPGYEARIADALATAAYWRHSLEYRFLDRAVRELADWPLAGPRTHRFRSPDDVEAAGLMFSRLRAPAFAPPCGAPGHTANAPA